MITLIPLDRKGIAWTQRVVTEYHYLHKPVDARCSVEGYEIQLSNYGFAGVLLFGRPQATKCRDWYGSVEDAQAGRCEVTRWQVLNLARVWICPEFQPGGAHWEYWKENGGNTALRYYLPGFVDRKDVFRSTLASDVLRLAAAQIGLDYLLRRPPCFLEEPYEIRWLLSYCDTRLHKGTIYQAAGFELYSTNDDGIQTWRIQLPALTDDQDNQVRQASLISPRSNRYRAQRSQLTFDFSA
jgi:hypothetical protein